MGNVESKLPVPEQLFLNVASRVASLIGTKSDERLEAGYFALYLCMQPFYKDMFPVRPQLNAKFLLWISKIFDRPASQTHTAWLHKVRLKSCLVFRPIFCLSIRVFMAMVAFSYF